MYSEFPALPALVTGIAQSVLATAMLLTTWRIWRGPSIADRVVALDLLSAQIMAQFVLLVFSSGFVSYLDVATAVAIISFIATVAFARYLENKEVPL